MMMMSKSINLAVGCGLLVQCEVRLDFSVGRIQIDYRGIRLWRNRTPRLFCVSHLIDFQGEQGMVNLVHPIRVALTSCVYGRNIKLPLRATQGLTVARQRVQGYNRLCQRWLKVESRVDML
ncbi:hypothetical protein ACOSQ3_023541 [Xanthoceras sorbifolium]